MLEPGDVLRAVAAARGSAGEGVPAGDAWHLDLVDQIDGEGSVHPALLALSDPERELERRVWAAEAGVLLPAVEQAPRRLLLHHGRLLRRALHW